METVNLPILEQGTAQPYLALFDQEGMPVMNPITGIPLGAYISSWSYVYDEETENTSTLTFETGDPDSVDIQALQEKSLIFLQWGYIFASGTFISSPIKSMQVRDFDCIFDSTGTHVTIKCIDYVGQLRYKAPCAPQKSLPDFIDRGCDHNIGVVIEKFD